MPPQRTDEPPMMGIFSKTTEESFCFTASQAAVRPAAPAPTMTTSKVSSHFFGARMGVACEAPERAAAVPARPPARKERRFMVMRFLLFA